MLKHACSAKQGAEHKFLKICDSFGGEWKFVGLPWSYLTDCNLFTFNWGGGQDIFQVEGQLNLWRRGPGAATRYLISPTGGAVTQQARLQAQRNSPAAACRTAPTACPTSAAAACRTALGELLAAPLCWAAPTPSPRSGRSRAPGTAPLWLAQTDVLPWKVLGGCRAVKWETELPIRGRGFFPGGQEG